MMATLAKPTLIDHLRETGAQVLTDAQTLDFFAHDIWSRGADLAAVVRPSDKHQLAAAVGAATAAGHPVVPRGGGWSYTGGYTQDLPGAVLFDMGAMNRVLEINETDMTVTVEAGCTWKTLNEALAPKGLRTPMWGTLSGIRATIGGGMSQNSIFFGTGQHGTAVKNVLALEMVKADGTLMKVGCDYLRPYGPDLVGLFLADNGAMGLKATITMQLIPEAVGHGYATFAFDTAEQQLAASTAIARAGLASECFGFDPHLNAIRMKRDSLAADARQLVGMMKKQGGILKGLKEGAKVALAGRDFLKDAKFSLHVMTEGRNQPAADADLAAVRQIALENGGREVENTIPKIVRANPFGPATMILSPGGDRWVPVHGVVRNRDAAKVFNAVAKLYDDNKELMDKHGIFHGSLIATIGASAVVVEPCLYWPDARNPVIDDAVPDDHLAKLPTHAHDAEVWAAVCHIKDQLVDLLFAMGTVHMQIARTYRYLDSLDPASLALLKAVKAEVDPHGLMNPGSLGLAKAG